jgi:hypothetical protein
MKVGLHSTNAASRLGSVARRPNIPDIRASSAPCHPGASLVSVRRLTFTTSS